MMRTPTRRLAGAPAIADGVHLYRGRKCRYGHSGLRYKVSRNCVACTREAAARRREAEKNYRLVEADVDS